MVYLGLKGNRLLVVLTIVSGMGQFLHGESTSLSPRPES